MGLSAGGITLTRTFMRALSAASVAALLLLPTLGALASTPGASPVPIGTSDRLRTPEVGRLDGSRSDLPVVAPASSRSPLASAANWTVLVYMVADNNLEPFALQDLNEMEAAPASTAVRIVVQVDRSRDYDTTAGDWNETRRYVIGHDADPSTFTSTLVAPLGELDMGDPQVLADFLAWGTDTYPADHYLVVLWDHGFGWMGFGDDYGSNDHLSLPELGSALQAGAAHIGRPFDLVAFDACLMQSVEVGYELGWVADYLVAAQDREPGPGWPYDKMLAPLIASPSIAPAALSAALVSAYMDHYGYQSEAMMSAVDLALLRTPLVNALSALAAEIDAVAENPQSAPASSAEAAVWAARAGSPGMYTGEAFDLGEFLRLLSEDTRCPDGLRLAASLAREAMNASIVEEAHSVYYVGWSGIAIHFPSISVSSRYAANAFARDGFWDEALTAAITGVKVGAVQPSIQVLSPSPGAAVAREFVGSAQAASAGGGPLRVQFKAGWGPFEDVASGSPPLPFSGVLDAGIDSGAAVLTFRAVSSEGLPSPAVERAVLVEGAPLSFAPPLTELALAVNRTRSVSITATPRAPYQAFDIGWLILPSGISGAGTTNSVNLPTSPPPPFNVSIVLTANATAPEGTFPAILFVRAAASPAVAAYLRLDLVVSRPLPDLAVAPLVLSEDLPLPAEVVNATTTIANLGFEDVPLARITAVFVDTTGNATEVANFTAGPLHPGDTVSWSGNFTAARGSQSLTVRAVIEPLPVEELSATNNEAARTVVVVNFSVAVVGPPEVSHVALGPSPTAVALTVENRGTDPDTYDLTVLNLSNVSWQAALRVSSLAVAGRNASVVWVDVLLPIVAQGGDEATFEVRAVSQADAGVEASAAIPLRVDEIYDAILRPLPNTVTLPAGGSANVTLSLQNTGNGRETFAVALEGVDPALGVHLDAASLTLAPGQGGSPRLTLTDNGLVSADRPYTVEAVAVSLSSGARFGAIVSVQVEPSPLLQVDPLEPRIDAAENGSSAFHVRITNIGNTNAIASLAAASPLPGLQVEVPTDATRLEPGSSIVLNGTTTALTAPRAGSYALAFTAADALSGANATASAQLAVAEVHDLRGTLSVAAGEARTLVRVVVVENHGNTPEFVTVVLGYVPVGTRLEVDPPNDTFIVDPGANLTLTLRITGPTNAGASGAIELVLKSQGGTVSLPFEVSYDFTAPPPPPILEWAVVIGVAAGGLAAWSYATRRKTPPPPA